MFPLWTRWKFTERPCDILYQTLIHQKIMILNAEQTDDEMQEEGKVKLARKGKQEVKGEGDMEWGKFSYVPAAARDHREEGVTLEELCGSKVWPGKKVKGFSLGYIQELRNRCEEVWRASWEARLQKGHLITGMKEQVWHRITGVWTTRGLKWRSDQHGRKAGMGSTWVEDGKFEGYVW